MYVNQLAGLKHHSASSSQPNIQFMFNMPLVHFVCNSSQVFFLGLHIDFFEDAICML